MTMNPKMRDILLLLGVTGFVAAALIMPGLPKALSPFLRRKYQRWGHFNKRRLKMEIKRLQKIGVIEQLEQDGEMIFKLTDKGKTKLLKYKLEEMTLNKKHWDGKWRLVAYDIPKIKKNQAEAFRELLKKMGFYQLQKSLWLTPYQCSEEIEFLKNLYNLEDHVTILAISGLEGEKAYRDYFGL